MPARHRCDCGNRKSRVIRAASSRGIPSRTMRTLRVPKLAHRVPVVLPSRESSLYFESRPWRGTDAVVNPTGPITGISDSRNRSANQSAGVRPPSLHSFWRQLLVQNAPRYARIRNFGVITANGMSANYQRPPLLADGSRVVQHLSSLRVSVSWPASPMPSESPTRSTSTPASSSKGQSGSHTRFRQVLFVESCGRRDFSVQ